MYISALKSRGAFFVDDISLKLTPSGAPFAPAPIPTSDGSVLLPLPPVPLIPQTESVTLPTDDAIGLPTLPTNNND